MFFFGIVHHRSRDGLYERSAATQEHRVYAAVIDREAVQSLAEVGLFAYEARLIAGSTTQINVNRFAKHYYGEESQDHCEKSFI